MGATRSTCGGCGLIFNAMDAFDMHRVGEFEVIETGPKGKQKRRHNRRCLTIPEMQAIGMKTNDKGWWTTGKHDPAAHQDKDEGEAAD